MRSSVIFIGGFIILCSYYLSLSRLLNCLIVLENLNVLLLFCSLVNQWAEARMFFLALMVIFTIEVVLGLVVLTRLWSSSRLIGIVGW